MSFLTSSRYKSMYIPWMSIWLISTFLIYSIYINYSCNNKNSYNIVACCGYGSPMYWVRNPVLFLFAYLTNYSHLIIFDHGVYLSYSKTNHVMLLHRIEKEFKEPQYTYYNNAMYYLELVWDSNLFIFIAQSCRACTQCCFSCIESRSSHISTCIEVSSSPL